MLADPRREPATAHRRSQAQTAAKEQQDAPRQAFGRGPVEGKHAALWIDGNQEQGNRPGHRDPGVVDDFELRDVFDDPRQIRERLASDPGESRAEKDDQHDHLASRHPAEAGQFIGDQGMAATKLRVAQWEQNADQEPPANGEINRRKRRREQQPVIKADRQSLLAHKAREVDVRRRSDEGSQASDAGRVRNAEHQAGCEILRSQYRPFVLLLARRCHLRQLPLHQVHNAQADRQHHQRGRRVADPHADERRGNHEAGDNAHRLGADEQHREQGHPPMQPPAFDGQSDQKTAQE